MPFIPPPPVRRVLGALAFAVGIAAVTWLSLSIHGPTANRAPPPEVPVWDKVLHMAAYAWLMAAGGLALGRARRSWWGWCGVGLVVFGAWIELVQARTYFHTGSPVDAAANGAGVLLVLWAARRLERRHRPVTE